MKLTTKTVAMVFGVVFLAVGILGFVPGITSNHHLLGIFEVDTVHNVIHLLSGVLALVLSSIGGKYGKMYLVGFGSVYGLVTIVGFLMNGDVLGLIHTNLADNLLHLVLSVALVGSGLVLPVDEA